MAQNKGENNENNAPLEKPEDSQQEQVETETNQIDSNKSSESLDALAKLEADLKAEKAEQNKDSVEQKKSAKTETSSVNNQKAAKKQQEVSQPPVVAPKSRSWAAIFALLFSLLAIAAVGFMWWQSQLWLKNQEQLNQLKQQSLLNTQQSLNQQQAQITDLLSKLSQQQNSQQATQQSIDTMQGRIKELGESQPNYWLAAEANYLINLSERRLLIEQDVGTALQLLGDANQRLSAMQEPNVFHIRTAISEDIAALRVVKQPNTDDVYLALSGLLSQVDQLAFAQVYIPDVEAQLQQDEQVTENIDDWQHNLKVSLQRFFAHFITIKKHDMQVQPQLPADQKWFVKANLTTQLLMAQNSVLDKNQPRYQDALTKLNQWTQQYFDLTKPEVVAFVTNLEHLAQQDVGLNLPNGLTSQPLIGNYVIEQLKLKEQHND